MNWETVLFSANELLLLCFAVEQIQQKKNTPQKYCPKIPKAKQGKTNWATNGTTNANER